MTGVVDGQGALHLARAVAGHDRAAAEHRWAVAEHGRAVQQRARVLGKHEQHLIDAEVRATRNALLHALRRHGGAATAAFLDEDFLSVADRPTIYRAIVDAALTVGGAASADLQLHDRDLGVLRIVAQRGFSNEFLAFFADVDAAQPTACARALASRQPVLVGNVRRSTIFSDQLTLALLLDTGTRSVHSYPLLAPAGDVIGVLSFHHHHASAAPSSRAELVARSAAQVMTQVR